MGTDIFAHLEMIVAFFVYSSVIFGQYVRNIVRIVMMYQKCDSLGLQLFGMYATIRTPWKGVER